MNISPTEEFLSDDTVIFESKLTVAGLLEMANYMLEDDSVSLTYITPEWAKDVEEELSRAVLYAIHDVIDGFIN